MGNTSYHSSVWKYELVRKGCEYSPFIYVYRHLLGRLSAKLTSASTRVREKNPLLDGLGCEKVSGFI